MILAASCLFGLLLPATISAANILILSALPAFSHHKWNSVIGEALGDRGHNVTILSPFFVQTPSIGVRYIFIDSDNSVYEDYTRKFLQRSGKQCAFFKLATMALLTEQMCNGNKSGKAVIESAGFRELLNYPSDAFDLIIHDFTGGPCLVPFVHKFNYAPLILATPYSNSPFLANIIGGHQYYSYVPHTVLPFDQTMAFWQRVVNFSFHLIQHFGREYLLLKRLDSTMMEHFGQDLPSISQLEKRATLALVNSNPILDSLGPLPDNVIAIGGMHIKHPKPLPKDLEIFLNSSRDGAVLFSFGSTLHANDLPMEKIQLFINVFREFGHYNFLWKFESNRTIENLPKNVCIRSWLPQSDVLAHPKLKAFVTHAGLLSTQEAVWRGVPMIVIPFMFDQHENMNKIKRLHMGEELDFYTLSHEKLRIALQKVLGKSKYSTNAKRLQNLVFDQHEKPLDRAIWWIEWVLRHPNEKNLQSPVIALGYMVGNSIDVLGFSAIIFIVHIYAACKLAIFVFKLNIVQRTLSQEKYCDSVDIHKKQQ